MRQASLVGSFEAPPTKGKVKKSFLEGTDIYSVLTNASVMCSQDYHVKGRMTCSKNPFCCYGWGDYSKKKEGIYKRPPDPVEKLGEDPKERRRRAIHAKSEDLCPVGLKNLGATCYLNVLMQSLFHNPLIRDAVFNLVPSTADVTKKTVMDDVVEALQGAFGHMILSERRSYSLSHFTRLLNLDDQEQQDPQEFNKLFMGKLEGIKLCSRDEGRRSIATLLEGKEVYLTTCNKCKSQRRRSQAFRNLDLNIEGYKSVDQALHAYFTPEMLTGDNQYQCDTCGGKQDATRNIEIEEAPPVLTIDLMRYVYDLKTYSKVKVKRRVRFEDHIDFQGEEYRLVSVLYHKGKSAHGGHYVAEVQQWDSGQWWHCDDAQVIACESPVRDLPALETSDVIEISATPQDYSKTPAKKRGLPLKAKAKSKTNSKGKDKSAEDDDQHDREEDGEEEEGGENGEEDIRSVMAVEEDTKERDKDKSPAPSPAKSAAKKRNRPAPKKKGDESSHISLNRSEDAYCFSYVKASLFKDALGLERLAPSAAVVELVAADNALQVAELEEYSKKRAAVEADIKQRKATFEQVRDVFVPKSAKHPFHLVPAHWLQQWMAGVSLPGGKGSQSSSPHAHEVAPVNGSKESPTVIDLKDEPLSTKKDDKVVDLVRDVSPENHTPDVSSSGACVFNDAIENLAFACPHSSKSGKMRSFPAPERLISDFKVVSEEAYQAMAPQTDYDFNSSNYRCEFCEQEFLAAAKSQLDQSQILAEIVELVEAEARESQPSFSKVVLSKWSKGLAQDVEALSTRKTKCTTSVDKTVNGEILCSHGQRCPTSLRKKTVRISDSTWQTILGVFPSAVALEHDDVCAQCKTAALSSREAKDSINNARAEQMDKSTCLKPLVGNQRVSPPSYPIEFDDKVSLLSPLSSACFAGKTFFAVDENWLSTWRCFHEDKSCLIPPPSPLKNTRLRCTHGLSVLSDSLRCIAEGKCPSETPQLGTLGGGLPQPVLVTQRQWQSLLHFYGAIHTAEERVTEATEPISEAAGRCEITSMDVETASSASEEDSEDKDEVDKSRAKRRRVDDTPFSVSLSVNSEGAFCWNPTPCMDCIASFKSKHAEQNANYESGTLTMIVLGAEESVPYLVESSSSSSSSSSPSTEAKEDYGENGPSPEKQHPSRRSTRKRKSRGQTFTITASSEDTLSLIVLKNSERLLQHADGKQTLYLHGRELIGKDKSLAELGICSGDVVHVRVEETPDPAGYDLSFDSYSRGGVESGFKGSFLSSGSVQRKPGDEVGLQSLRDACKEMGLEFKEHQLCGAYENAKGSVEVALSILTA